MDLNNSSLARLFLYPCLEAARNIITDLIDFQKSVNENKIRENRITEDVTVNIVNNSEELSQPVQHFDTLEIPKNIASINLEHIEEIEPQTNIDLLEENLENTDEYVSTKESSFDEAELEHTQDSTTQVESEIKQSKSVLTPKAKVDSLGGDKNRKFRRSKRSSKSTHTSKYKPINKKQLAHNLNQKEKEKEKEALRGLNPFLTLNIKPSTKKPEQGDCSNLIFPKLPFITNELHNRQCTKGLEEKMALINRKGAFISSGTQRFRGSSSLDHQINDVQPERVKVSRTREVDDHQDQHEDESQVKKTKPNI